MKHPSKRIWPLSFEDINRDWNEDGKENLFSYVSILGSVDKASAYSAYSRSMYLAFIFSEKTFIYYRIVGINRWQLQSMWWPIYQQCYQTNLTWRIITDDTDDPWRWLRSIKLQSQNGLVSRHYRGIMTWQSIMEQKYRVKECDVIQR